VRSEKEFEEFKLFKRQDIINQYTDLVDWLCFLYDNPRWKLAEEQVKAVTQAHNQILKINGYIEAKERTLRQDRDDIENRLVQKKKIFQENLEKIKGELEKFREYNTKRNEDEYNKQIASINAELANLTQEMREINDMEVDLDQPPTEYPEIDKYKLDIKPFEELWKMVKEQSQKIQLWNEGPILQLDPEEVEKDHKTIWQTAQKLVVKFGQVVPKMPKPEKVAKDIVDEMLRFRDCLPVIRAICNPGLKERHFD
jgi:dynein heavy chain, axonemal